MAKKKNQKKIKPQASTKNREFFHVSLPEETKKWAFGVIIFLMAIIIALSFFNKAGIAGKAIKGGLTFLFGSATSLFPLILILGGLVFFLTRYERFFGSTIFAILLLILGSAGIVESLNLGSEGGGWLGNVIVSPFLRFFDVWVTQIIFGGILLIGAFIFWHLLKQPASKSEKEEPGAEKKPSLIKKIFTPRFKIKEIEPSSSVKEVEIARAPELKLKTKSIAMSSAVGGGYEKPSLDLLDSEKNTPLAGDIRQNSAVIKKTLENFAIPVEMSEINTGPTVTQYALKPADGIKLAKITSLSNDLALALAAHPIRIEAPIPGKPLVGIEVPNKIRARVRLKDLIASPQYQNSPSALLVCLGQDVSGNPLYTDLARMPHLLVAGSTGTGKTIFLNSLILSLLYRNSPETMRFILVDPKRVEFPVYHDLPHLLCPVIYDAQRTINALKWLIGEMERRFEVLAEAKTRDIKSYNEQAFKNGEPLLPFIILIVDELADLMAARGREIEAGVIRLAQMARATGIHLVLATQRPSVEVITGLIKANITARVTFQVASQVDSRTVLDMAGAERLLGAGDMLFISSEFVKPRRVQGAYVSEKEVRRVADFIKAQKDKLKTEQVEEILESQLTEELGKTLEMPGSSFENFSFEEETLYNEAKKIVIESKKASASLLQRKLRIGYARAARLIDMLEEKGVVGPGEGAKPREVYLSSIEGKEYPQTVSDAGNEEGGEEEKKEEEGDNDGWRKV